MRTCILWGGLESSFYPDLIKECKNYVDSIYIIDTPFSRSGEEHVLNKSLEDKYVSEVLLSEPNNIEEIKERIAIWRNESEVRFSLNITEEFLVSSAICNDYFGWRGPGLSASYISSNKSVQRGVLSSISPRKYNLLDVFSSPESISFPIVIKPVGSHGGDGYTFIESAKDLEEIKSINVNNHIAEEYVQGIDCSVEAIVVDGEVLFQGVTEEISLPAPQDYLEMGYYQPPIAISLEAQGKLKALNKKLIREVQFRTGLIHAEYRVKKDGDVRFIEFAARPPGDSLLSMYRYSTGESLERRLIEAVLGEKSTFPNATRYVGQKFIPHTPGVFKGLESERDTYLPVANYYAEDHTRSTSSHIRESGNSIHEINVLVKRGFDLGPLIDASSRVASVIFSSESSECLSEFSSEVINKIKVNTERV